MSELHDIVTRNLRVLMAIRGIEGYATLAKTLGIDAASVSNKMRGKRQWNLDDIEKLAAEFRVPASALIGDVAALVDPAKTATGTEVNRTLRGSRGYLPAHPPAQILLFPQVNPAARNLNQDAHVIPLSRTAARSRRQVTQLATRPSQTINASLAQVSDFLLHSRAIG